ncbi:FAD:protein FMN transferase [Cryobacterium sp. PH29-G1]|uniref:FAD:protein FMN transferase n=1 Tax=Cryobacterium sp. PH29-G1 TaxID=3046211 RepID=UPI0024B960F0|nr:FAD:protein FMN transferase [Cryobacterium sp. PH29-G1]MDJ0348900.1 FAD:protein FMN transferase [Cryobacterium sp. PH29-G1]
MAGEPVAGDSIARDAVRAVFTATGTRPQARSRRQPLMGGSAKITLVGASAALLDATFVLADRLEQLWSRFVNDSDISRLNWAEGRAVDVDQLTVRLIRAMQSGAELTRNDYNPTLLPDLLEAGYTTSTVDSSRVTRLPTTARSPGDLAGIRIDGTRVLLPRGTTLDAGGIGKGLAADLVCGLAMSEGARGALAEIGGDIVVCGEGTDGQAWRLGVEDPFDPAGHCDVVRLGTGALATSSQRKRRFKTAAGERHHLLDPRTRTSATTGIQTVSVIATTGARAECLTKPGFLRPTADYLAWLPTVGAAGLVVHQTGAVATSANWSLYR